MRDVKYAKKWIYLVMSCIFLINSSVVSAQSNKNNEKVIFNQKEITDMNKIEERLTKGITDDKEFKAKCLLSKDTIVGLDGKEYFLKVASVKATSQKIKETVTDNGDSTVEYSGYIVVNISL